MAYTCITCRLVFAEPELQRSHYKTDWHRYNLKRKVAGLPCVTAEDFKEKVIVQQSLAAAAEADKKTSPVCTVCKKRFVTVNAYNCHVQSKKHIEKATADKKAKEMADNAAEMPERPVEPEAESPIVVEEECEPEPLELNECLFCSKLSDDLESSLEHMTREHGFFVPELQYLVDLKGLLGYLCRKVGVECRCLYCNERGKTFYSVEAVQKHMVDKSHCKMFFEDDAALEYAEFYDYSSSYPEGHEGPECQTVALAPEALPYVNEDLELVLPSGVAVGHRALKYVYKQRAPTDEHRKALLIGRLMAQYRALGIKGYNSEELGKRARDERWFGRMQKAREMKLGVKANKLQHHYRPQIMM